MARCMRTADTFPGVADTFPGPPWRQASGYSAIRVRILVRDSQGVTSVCLHSVITLLAIFSTSLQYPPLFRVSLEKRPSSDDDPHIWLPCRAPALSPALHLASSGNQAKALELFMVLVLPVYKRQTACIKQAHCNPSEPHASAINFSVPCIRVCLGIGITI